MSIVIKSSCWFNLGVINYQYLRLTEYEETIINDKDKETLTMNLTNDTLNTIFNNLAISFAVDLEELQVPDWIDDEVEDAVEM